MPRAARKSRRRAAPGAPGAPGGAGADVGAPGGGPAPPGAAPGPSEREGELAQRLDEELTRAGAMQSRVAALEAAERDLRERLRLEQLSKERLQASHTRVLQEREDALKRRLREMEPAGHSREESLVAILEESQRLQAALEDQSAQAQAEAPRPPACGAGSGGGEAGGGGDGDFERLKARIAAMRGAVDSLGGGGGGGGASGGVGQGANAPSQESAGKSVASTHALRGPGGSPGPGAATPSSAVAGQGGRPRSQSKVSWGETVVEKIGGVQSFLSAQIENLPQGTELEGGGCAPPAPTAVAQAPPGQASPGSPLYPSLESLDSGPLPESVRRLRALGTPRWAGTPEPEPRAQAEDLLVEEAALGFEALVASYSGTKAPRPAARASVGVDRATERFGLQLAGVTPRSYSRRLTVLDDNVKAVAREQEELLQMEHDSRDNYLHSNFDSIERRRASAGAECPSRDGQRADLAGGPALNYGTAAEVRLETASATPPLSTGRPLHRLPSPETAEITTPVCAAAAQAPHRANVYTPEDEIRALRHERDIFRNRAKVAEDRASKAKEDLTDVIDELLDAKADLEEERRRRAVLLREGLPE